ncbi:calcium-binding protein [Loktanella sp. S4079]|uniref:calcium-binding protein n=1 Tax=Loktanella sp. S4079 TaxID=579483 RepID=UPI000698ED0E|nr:hypothetical protein [Loktanella sp. S4079]
MYVTLAVIFAALGIAFMAVPEDDDDEATTDGEIRGSKGDDDIVGTDGDDTILSWAGNDHIAGGDGNDEIRPGPGDDVVYGGNGQDWIVKSPGDDVLHGQVGRDRIFGGAGDDYIDGGYGSDTLGGNEGNDTILGGFDARLEDGALVPAADATDDISGGDGDDTIYIWGGDGEARGDDGADDLILVTGSATLEAGAGLGDDFYVLANVTDAQLSEATITDFDPSRDTLTLTVDHVPEGGTLPDVDVTMTETTVDGVSGVRVEAVYTGDGDTPAESEGAVAFLQGMTIELLSPANIAVVSTEEADLFDPEATMGNLVA